MKVDLHLHTSASDGRLSPRELVALAARLGLEVMAITDHDTVEGIGEAMEAARAFPGLRIIPGVELSTDIPREEVHILGYFIDHRGGELQNVLGEQRRMRLVRGQRMVEKLSALGIHITWPRVLEISGGGAVGRPHIAQAMLEKGYISSFREAFDRFIGRNGPAYVEREKLTPAQAVALVARAGGLPALAHAGQMAALEALLPQLRAAGLAGLEAYYNGYPPETSRRLEALARHYSLLTCGGSDYHGLDQAADAEPGSVAVPQEAVRRFLEWGEERGARSP